jgi:hypothetical protein
LPTERRVEQRIPGVARSPQALATVFASVGLGAARQGLMDVAESHSDSAPAASKPGQMQVTATLAPPVSHAARLRPARGTPVHRFRQPELPVCLALE